MGGRSCGRLTALVAVLAALCAAAPAGASRDRAAARRTRPDAPATVLVKFKQPSSAAAKIHAAGDSIAGTVGERVHIVRVRSGQTAAAKAAEYAKRADVEYAEPALRLQATLAAPDDPFGSAWWLDKVNALEGWSIYPNSYSAAPGVKIAILDTGIDPAHPDLDAKIDAASGANCIHWNFSGICRPWGIHDPVDPPGYGTVPLDDHGHGTHVAGIAGAETNNATGVAGMALNSPLIPIKVLDLDGFAYDYEIANGVLWAKNHGASVINMSIGSSGLSTTLCNAVAQAISAGVVVVAAAGNSNTLTPSAPAGCPGAVGVAATTSLDTKASFSNFGSPNVFVSAPGVGITSTYPGGGYVSFDGTSMASPFVAGLAALLRSQQTLSVADVKHILARTSDKIGVGAYGADPYHTCGVCTWNTVFGYGRINAERALHGMTPVISTFTPASAPVGSLVTFNGDALGGATSVTFTGAAPVTPTTLTVNSIRATVPADAGIGPITVTTPAGSAASATSFKPLPRVTAPVAAVQVGDTVSLSGTNLADVTAVKIGAVSLAPGSEFTVVSPTQLDVVVPDAAITAAVSVTSAAGTGTSTTPLKIRPTLIEPFTPAEGFTGTVVTVSGKTLVGTSAVKVGGVAAPFVLLSATSLRLTVPPAAVSGPIAVTNVGGTTTTGGSFTVDPKITGFAPVGAAVGGLVTLSGSGFGAVGESRVVTVNGVAAASTWVSPNSVKLTVPAGATTGMIGLTVGSALPASSATALKVLPRVTGYSSPAAKEGEAVTVVGSTLDGATSLRFGVITAGIESISLDGTEIETHVPAGALTGAVTVVTPGGTSVGPVFKVLPTVSEPFAPAHGFTGTMLTLSGKTFVGTSAVKVGGVAAPFAVLSATSLRVTVPANAVTGTIAVTNAGGTTTTAGSFTVDPKITGFAPLAGVVGQEVALTGSGLGASGETRLLTVNGIAAASTWVSPNSVKLTVPAGATTGMIGLTVGSALPASSATAFKVLPKITGYSPAQAREGDAVTVQGTTLDGATSLKFGVITAGIESISLDGTQIETHVPAGALTGAVTVVTPGGTSVGPALKILPTINEPFSPSHGFTGTTITLAGKSFSGTSAVKLGGVAAPFVLLSPTSLRLTVPPAAVSGPIAVTNAGGTTTTADSFTVDPKITAFSPLSAATGATLIVNGSGFGGADRVDFAGGVSAVPTNVLATSLKVVIPAGAATGPISVHTPAGSSAPSTVPFTATFSVTSISPTTGNYGDDVTITGIGLTGVTAVKFNNIAGALQPGGTATTLHVHVPASGAVSGHVTVWKGLASVQAPQDFTLLVISSVAPAVAMPGTDVTLLGHGFTGATSVKFNGTNAATFTVDNDGQITARVPASATTGQVSVTVAAGTVTSAGAFTVSTVKINEFSTGASGASTDEFVELMNTGSTPAELRQCKLVYSDGTTLWSWSASTVVASGGYLVVGGAGYTGPASPYSFTTDLNASMGGVALECGAGEVIVDRVGWGAVAASFIEGTAAEAPAAGTSASRVPDGADSQDNSVDFQTDPTATPGASNAGS